MFPDLLARRVLQYQHADSSINVFVLTADLIGYAISRNAVSVSAQLKADAMTL
jgi:hypothetical protein